MMPIKSLRFLPVLLLMLHAQVGASELSTPSNTEELKNAAHLLVMGTEWSASSSNPDSEFNFENHEFSDAIAFFEDYLSRHPKEQQAVTRRAILDTFGTLDLTSLEVSAEIQSALEQAKASPMGYAQQMEGYLKAMGQAPSIYEEVIVRAYQWTLYREPYEEELQYWREQKDTYSYLLLVGALEHWARQNQPGLMVTGGDATVWMNCEFWETQRVSPELAEAICNALPMLFKKSEPAASCSKVLSPHAFGIQSSGDVFFIPVGSEDLRTASQH